MTVEDRFDPRDGAWHQDNHFCLGLIISVVRLAAGPSWRPAEVHLQTDEAPGLRDAESLAFARVAFRQPETMVAIPRALLATRLPLLPPAEIPTDVEDWKSSAPGRDFAGSIRQAVETLACGEDYPSVRQTADFAGMSARTCSSPRRDSRRPPPCSRRRAPRSSTSRSTSGTPTTPTSRARSGDGRDARRGNIG